MRLTRIQTTADIWLPEGAKIVELGEDKVPAVEYKGRHYFPAAGSVQWEEVDSNGEHAAFPIDDSDGLEVFTNEHAACFTTSIDDVVLYDELSNEYQFSAVMTVCEAIKGQGNIGFEGWLGAGATMLEELEGLKQDGLDPRDPEVEQIAIRKVQEFYGIKPAA